MKFVAILLFALFGILLNFHVSSQVADDVETSMEMLNLWPQGTPIPYEISNQFNKDDFALIKASLVEIMRSTCLTFVPRTKKEEDYIVFMEYKDQSQTKGTCWSGKSKDMGFEKGYQKGRHVISLWRDLGCFNKFNLIYEVFRILGFSPDSSIIKENHNKGYSTRKDHGPYIKGLLLRNYEKASLYSKDSVTYLRISCDADLNVTRRHPFAFDTTFTKLANFTGKSPCNQLEDITHPLNQENLEYINTLYDCDQINEENENASDLKCIDENENCHWWADIGECHNNPDYMLWKCRYSCKQCDDGEPDQLNCKDFFSDDCPKWAAIDLCERDSWVSKYCRVSCKQCGKPKSSKPVENFEEMKIDKATLLRLPPVSPDCAAEVDKGTCESDPDYMKAICNNNTICETDKENTCFDKDKVSCPSLAFKGDCETSPEFMQHTCKGSCNVKCCADNHINCGLWASKGHCVLKPGEMLVNCKRSCRNCEFCEDRNDDCTNLAENGECTKNPNHMTLYCPKSCTLCG